MFAVGDRDSDGPVDVLNAGAHVAVSMTWGARASSSERSAMVDALGGGEHLAGEADRRGTARRAARRGRRPPRRCASGRGGTARAGATSAATATSTAYSTVLWPHPPSRGTRRRGTARRGSGGRRRARNAMCSASSRSSPRDGRSPRACAGDAARDRSRRRASRRRPRSGSRASAPDGAGSCVVTVTSSIWNCPRPGRGSATSAANARAVTGKYVYCICPASVWSDRRVEAARAVDVPDVARVEQRREERQALDVVPVGVADEQMAATRAAGSAISAWPSSWIAGAAVEHEQRAGVGAHLDARGVAAVADRGGPGLGDRTPRAPEGDFHSAPTLVARRS